MIHLPILGGSPLRFKKLFGSEPNKDLLIDFLNELLRDKKQIKDLTYSKNEHFGKTPEDRKAIFDLYCENENGEKSIIELQKVKQRYFKDRSIYYLSKKSLLSQVYLLMK